MKLIFTLLTLTGIATAAVNTGAVPLGYTCTDSPGEKKTCTCDGALDCFWMARAGVCGSDIVLECELPPSQKCSCEWKKKSEDVSLGRPKGKLQLRIIDK